MMHTQIDKTVHPDAKGRVTLGKLAEGVSSYRVSVDKKGRVVLEPYVEIPAREQWLYQNPEAMKSVIRGLADMKNGKLHNLGDFTQFLDDDDL